MKIGCIGSGSMTKALATQWANKGHEVLISGRTLAKAEALAKNIGNGAKAGSVAESVTFGDVILLAVPNESVMDVLAELSAIGGSLDGKILIDCNNAVTIEADKTVNLKVGHTTSFAERIAETAPGAKVVKAFNMCQAKVWEMTPPVFDGRPLTVLFCGDDADAKSAVAQLIGDIGCTPIDMGALHRARLIEAAGALVIHLLFNGYDPKTVLNLIVP